MSAIDIEARDSFSCPSDCRCPGVQSESVYLGHQKSIYLFFALPPFFSALPLRARLILFKIPTFSDLGGPAGQAVRYTMYPLLEPFSFFSGLYSAPLIDCGLCVSFHNLPCLSYTQLDVTQIVRSWIGGEPENHGLLLTGGQDSPYVFYASNRYPIAGMRPTLRLIFADKTRPCGLRAVPCEVAVTGSASAAQ